MKKRLLVSLGALFLLAAAALGQTEDRDSSGTSFLRIGVAGLHYQAKDQLVSPLSWSGIGPGLRFSYLVTNPSTEHEVEALLPVSFLSNRYDYSGYAWEIHLAYAVLWRLNASVFGGCFSVGTQIKWNANCQFYADWDDSHLYWLNIYEVSPAVKWTREYDAGQRLSIAFHVPLVAVVSRPPEYQYTDQPPLNKFSYYLDALHENLRLTSLNNYVALGLKTDYAFIIGKGTVCMVSWLFDYKTCRSPRRISIVSNTVSVCYLIAL